MHFWHSSNSYYKLLSSPSLISFICLSWFWVLPILSSSSSSSYCWFLSSYLSSNSNSSLSWIDSSKSFWIYSSSISYYYCYLDNYFSYYRTNSSIWVICFLLASLNSLISFWNCSLSIWKFPISNCNSLTYY